MKKRQFSFRLIYLIYAAVLAVLILAATLYVGSLLRGYENSQPESHAKQAVKQLISDIKDGDLWSAHSFPDVSASQYEADTDLKQAYLALLEAEGLKFVSQPGQSEDELLYHVEDDGFCLAQVKLKADGPAYTKLAVFSMRDWHVESVEPVLSSHDYTLSVPSSFRVQINGVDAQGETADRQTVYTLSGLYLKPQVTITDSDGNTAEYKIKKDKIVAEYFDYSLTLPSTLSVQLNGAPYTGEQAGDDLVHYSITSMTQPQVSISDLYGNTVDYEGGSELPLTYATITADERCKVLVQGKEVPAQAVSTSANPEYENFAMFVDDLPGLSVYRIAVLENDASLSVTDPLGSPIALEQGQHSYDFSHVGGLDTVPEEVSEEINVLNVAQNWSLFLTRDYSFSNIKKVIVPDSYQYDVAYRYAYGIDITFTSKHTLADPPFVDNKVGNFVWITDDCFSVDISFVKHMYIWNGLVEDPMNDRFYFVKHDGDWKLASMKEIVDNAD